MSDLQAGIELGRTLERIESRLALLEIAGANAELIAAMRVELDELRGRVFVAEETVADVQEDVAEEIADDGGDGNGGDGGDGGDVEINIENVVEGVQDALEDANDAIESAGEAVEETVDTALEEAPANDSVPERAHPLDRPLFGNRG